MEAPDPIPRIGRFSDLSGAYHSAASKVLVCKECTRTAICPKKFARDHKIPETTMLRMMRQYQADLLTGISTFRDSGCGRPSKLDSVAEAAILEVLEKRRRDQKALNRAEFKSIVLGEIEQTAKRRNIADTKPRLSSESLRRYKRTMNLGEKFAQLKTNARIEAEYDPRNSFAMAAMVEAFCKYLSPAMIFNWDATQYALSPDKDEICIFQKGSNFGPHTTESGGGTFLSIKHYHFHNANGTVAPPVFVIADDSMDPEAFVWDEAPELSTSTDVNGKAYLCRCRTRNANSAFYRWYGIFIVAPFVNDVRDRTRLTNPDGSPMRAFVTCDGEQEQIKVFQHEDLLDIFSHAKIDFGKVSASCSGKLQSSDVSPLFRAIKTKIHSVENRRYASELIHTALVPLLEKGGYSPPMRAKINDSLQKVVNTIRAVMTAEMVVAGYERTGQYPLDFGITMRQSTYMFNLEEWDTITRNFDKAVKIFRLRGELTEAEMDVLEIPSVKDSQRNKKPKDERLLHQQRAVIMNSADCIAKYKNYHVSKVTAAAQKAIARQEKEAARDAAKDAKQAEKDRFDNLSKEQKTAERREKRRVNAAAKFAKAAASDPADALSAADDDGDDELDLFNDYEIFNLD
jgi:hypothetical protein